VGYGLLPYTLLNNAAQKEEASPFAVTAVNRVSIDLMIINRRVSVWLRTVASHRRGIHDKLYMWLSAHQPSFWMCWIRTDTLKTRGFAKDGVLMMPALDTAVRDNIYLDDEYA
jgi:hypothetical protein